MQLNRCILYFKEITAVCPSVSFINIEKNCFFDEIIFKNPVTGQKVMLFRTRLHPLSKKAVVYIEM